MGRREECQFMQLGKIQEWNFKGDSRVLLLPRVRPFVRVLKLVEGRIDQEVEEILLGMGRMGTFSSLLQGYRTERDLLRGLQRIRIDLNPLRLVRDPIQRLEELEEEEEKTSSWLKQLWNPLRQSQLITRLRLRGLGTRGDLLRVRRPLRGLRHWDPSRVDL